MALVHDCIACQAGDHANHVPTPGPVPEGMVGGWVCDCKGNCKAPPPMQFVKDTTDYAAIAAQWPPGPKEQP